MRDTRHRCPHCNAEVPTPAEAYAHHETTKPIPPKEISDQSEQARAEDVAPAVPGQTAAAKRAAAKAAAEAPGA